MAAGRRSAQYGTTVSLRAVCTAHEQAQLLQSYRGMRRLCLITCVVVGSSACSSGPDLPDGWEDAERVERFEQRPCSRQFETPDETLAWQAHDAGLSVTYDHAQFRCEQNVEAYRRDRNDMIDLLVQPVDMDPSKVAGCDCLYEISMDIPAMRGAYKLTLYRRWDNESSPNPLVKIGADDVSVP
jgi:hypothetical protein